MINFKSSTKTALVCNDLRVSYRELFQNIKYFSGLYDPETTQKVVIFSENRPGWVYSFYSAWKNGCIAVPVDNMSTVKELAFILNDCTPEVIFCSKEKLPALNEALTMVSHEMKIIIIDEAEDKTGQEIIEKWPEPDLQKTAVIIYTSGTTGSPKGVMLSFENLLANVDAVYKEIGIYKPEDRVMILLPLHHIFPLVGSMLIPLYVGGTVAIAPSMASADIIKTLQDNKITIIIGVPRLYNAIRKGIKDKIDQKKIAKRLFSLADKLNSKGFSKFIFKAVHKKFGGALKYLVCGGAAIDPEVARDYQILGFEMIEGYGMTEAAPMITFTPPGKVKIGSAGQILPGAKVEIRDGEIVAAGKNIMQGYYNREEETRQVLKNGWLYTGDLGYFDEEGFIHITGRKKEIIVLSNGKNINPVEIEFAIEEIPHFVGEVGVFMKDDLLQAVIFPDKQKLKEHGVKNIEQMFRWDVINKYNQAASPYKKIMSFTIIDEELPKTRLGKIQRFKLAGLVDNVKKESKESKEKETVNFKEYLLIKEFLEKEKGKEVTPDDHLEIDLALDSLDKVSLHVFLESTFGVNIKVEELVKYQSVLKLSEYVAKEKVKINLEEINWGDILSEKIHVRLPKSWVTSYLIVKFAKYFFYLYFRFKGSGVKNIPDTPCIIAPNHQSFFDGLFVASFLRNRQIKRTFAYTKEKYVKTKWLKFIANRNNIIIVDLNLDLKLSIQKLAEALRKKKNLLIFPEGTRTLNGQLGNFKKTFAILSQELNVPIVPVTINGAFDAFPSRKKFPKLFKKISIEFLKPVYPANHTYESIVELVQNKIQNSLKK